MNVLKQTIKVADLMQNPNNPRKDFGEIDQLADSLRATGGRPIQPLIVVRNGSRYVIVDGDRRYQAMCELGTEECDVLVCSDWTEASQAVAMIATDNKKPLTPEERASGMQLMFTLGVNDEDVSYASGVEMEDVRRVRRGASVAAPDKQYSLDVLKLAGDEGLDEEDRRKVLDAGLDGYWKAFNVARRIRDERADAQNWHNLKCELERFFCVFEDRPEAPYHIVEAFRDVEEAVEWAQHVPQDERVDYVVYGPGNGLAEIYSSLEPVESEEERKKREKEEERKRMLEEHTLAYYRALDEMLGYVYETRKRRKLRADMLVDLVRESCRAKSYYFGRLMRLTDHDDDDDLLCEAAMSCQPSMIELVDLLAGLAKEDGFYDWRGIEDKYSAQAFADVYDAMVVDGWNPGPPATALRAKATEIGGEE